MNWDKVISSVGSIAPGICASIGGPAGAVAGLGVKALCSFFGVEPEAVDAPAQVEAALKAMTPEQAILLKKQDQDFQKSMEELDVYVFELEVRDKDSARKREQEVGSRETAVLAYMAVLSFVGVVGIVLYALVFGSGIEQIGVLGGSLIGSIVTLLSQKVEAVFNYFFGSSKGSAVKNIMLGNQISEQVKKIK